MEYVSITLGRNVSGVDRGGHLLSQAVTYISGSYQQSHAPKRCSIGNERMNDLGGSAQGRHKEY